MTLRLVAVGLLFVVGGGNAEHLRGGTLLMTRELTAGTESSKSKATGDIEEPSVPATTKAHDADIRDDPVTAPPLSPVIRAADIGASCLCDGVCVGCKKLGGNTAYCKTACSFVGKDNCNEQCSAFLRGETVPAASTKAPNTGGIRDDPTIEPSLPLPTTTKAPTAIKVPNTTKAPNTGGNPTCKPCDSICMGCINFGVQTADCNQACGLLEKPNCTQLCSDFINGVGGGDIRDDPTTKPPLPPTDPPVCQCVALCQHCKEVGSDRQPCKTVCDYAQDPDCIPKCNALLHNP